MKFFIKIQILLLLTACGGSTVKQSPVLQVQKKIEGWKSLDEKNYSIQYPPEWELNQSGQMGLDFILFSPLENAKDQFRENVNLVTEDVAGKNIDLNKYTKLCEEQIKTMITNSVLLDSKRIKVGDINYHRTIFTGVQGIYNLKFVQYYMVENEKAYVVTFTCTQATYSAFKEVGENILNSFYIIPL